MIHPHEKQILAERLSRSAGRAHAVILDQNELLALGPEWEELVDNAVQENPYYARRYVEAQLAHIEKRPLQALAVWQDHTLIALLPFIRDPWRWGGIAYVNKSWTTPYTTLSVPLIDARYVATASAALIAAMAKGIGGCSTWLLLDITIKGTAFRHLSHALIERNLEWKCFDLFDRAVLSRSGTFEEHLQTHLSKNRRKSLARNRRKLEELGKLTLETHTEGESLDRALDHFLRLEQSGWKGKAGTALASQPHTKDFAQMAFGNRPERSAGGASAQPATRIDLLLLDEKPIAASVSIQAGRTAFTLKSAFDETFRNHSPGLLLEEGIIKEFLNGNWADRLDSAADAGHVLENLWNGTMTVGDILVTTGKHNARLLFSVFSLLETGRRLARQTAKRLLAAVKR